ncbi:MAG TPA: DUF481 domain-containing protein [Bryobacteraceae bacterium]|nr:DUF481 domain-containing protein [Bryobacteraceae bacterium]
MHAQPAPATPPPAPDVLVFTNGDRLVGQFVRSTGASVTFKSDMLGEITVDWAKIKELHSAQQFAVVEKGVRLGKHEDASKIPQGAVTMTDQKLEVRPKEGQAPQTIPVTESAYVIEENTFQRAVMHQAGWREAWAGSITGGASLVEATQHSRTFTGAISLVRALPTEAWLDRRNRTMIDFNASYGTLSQPGVPDLKTEIYHLGLERDEYFTPRVFAFGQMTLDHNFSQGLSLQQTYGGGIGWTAIKNDNEELDLKASLTYVGQRFITDALPGLPPGFVISPYANQQLFGSTFGETYNRKFARGILFNQQLSVTPAWNNLQAYSGLASASLLMPVYKRFSVNLGTSDTFLNNPPPGFRKWSLQFIMGLTYTLP